MRVAYSPTPVMAMFPGCSAPSSEKPAGSWYVNVSCSFHALSNSTGCRRSLAL